MVHPKGEARKTPLRVNFDRRLKLKFHGSDISSDAGALPYRELDDALGLTELGGEVLSETRRGMNTRHLLVGLLRQSVFGRLAGYEDVNDAECLSQDPVMRAIVDRKGLNRMAASTSEMGRFETEWLATDDNLAALTELSGAWIERVHERKPPKMIVLDMDSSESPTYGEQEGSAYNLGNFLRTLALPEAVEHWSLTTLREKLIKIGAKVVSHGRNVTFQMAEVAIPRPLFAEILRLIDGLGPKPAPT